MSPGDDNERIEREFDEVLGDLGKLSVRLAAQRYPGKAWPARAARPPLRLWRVAALAAAAVILVAIILSTRPQSRPPVSQAPIAKAPAPVAAIPADLAAYFAPLNLDPCMGGNLPTDTPVMALPGLHWPGLPPPGLTPNE